MLPPLAISPSENLAYAFSCTGISNRFSQTTSGRWMMYIQYVESEMYRIARLGFWKRCRNSPVNPTTNAAVLDAEIARVSVFAAPLLSEESPDRAIIHVPSANPMMSRGM